MLNKIECMDCLEYLKKVPDNHVDLVVTDPPYNVSQKQDIKYKDFNITKNFGDWDFGFDPVPVMKELKRVLKPNGQIFVFCSTKQIPEYMAIFEEDWFFRNLIVWSKSNPAPRLSKTNFVFANEYIVYAINEKVRPSEATFNYLGHSEMFNFIQSSTLLGKERLRDENNKAIHPTQKPLALLKRFISICSDEGDIVLDPFMGVGSTAVAAKELGRNFMGCELDRNYYKSSKVRI